MHAMPLHQREEGEEGKSVCLDGRLASAQKGFEMTQGMRLFAPYFAAVLGCVVCRIAHSP